ncbi:MAG: chromosome segregation protein SMC [Aeoliella sp.]
MLKALELTGFKSFAERARFEFHEGVTVVVGPNGSGKSNVVDAIKWVLGSQSAKSLRGSEMTDVIFNGSSSRGALHTAEVTLLLDNSAGHYHSESRFGGETREVAITRRVYRSGEGEYLINGSACRLRDIRDLLAGSGIGTEAYSIIEQGKVDALLQASPRDRRAIFEEAAGISRFRAKRQEAARRLARVEQNLLRLSDIVDEVESQLRSVRMQAGKAQRYRDGANRLKQLRTQIGIADWNHLSERLEHVSSELNQFLTEHNGRREWIAAAEREMPQIDAAMQLAQDRCEKLDVILSGLREKIVVRKATESGLLARQQDLEANCQRLEQQWLAARTMSDPIEPTDGEIEARHDVAKSEYDDATRAAAAACQQERQLASTVERGRAQLAEIGRRLADIERREALAQQAGQLVAEQHAQSPSDRLRIEEEAASLVTELKALAAELSSAESNMMLVSEQCRSTGQELNAAQELLNLDQSRLTDLQRESAQIESQLSSHRHRFDLISELDREQSETQDQVRQFMEKVSGERVAVVADLLHVDADTAPVIEAALGALAEYFVIPRTDSVLSATSPIPPGAKLLRFDWQGPASAIDRLDLSDQQGVWGRADQFVDSEPEYAPLVRRLLGRTWIVDTLATAVGLASAVGHGLHFVTADGDFLSADGTLLIGGRQKARGVTARRRQMEQLTAEIDLLTPRHAKQCKELDQLEKEIHTNRSRVAKLLDEHQSTLAKQSDARHNVSMLQGSKALLSERRSALEREQQQLEEKLELLDRERAKRELEHTALVQQRKQLSTAYATLESQLASADSEWASAREEAGRQEVAVAKLEHQIEILSRAARADSVSSPRAEIRQELSTQIEAVRARSSKVDQDRLACGGELALLVWQRDVLLPERRHAARQQAQLKQRREVVAQQLLQARRQVDDTNSRKAQLELAAAKIEHGRQTLAERLRDDYQIDLPAVAATTPPQPNTIDREQVEREINELREGLHRIGSVNTDALEELEAIESRFEAISAQYNDLSQAKTSLERLMAKLNNESRQLFLSTVDTVRGHFQELFRRLFGGGEADIVLEEYDSDDALECGVEIRACPPGKETRTISLLSGGEKTMTCVALLLAMFRSKPSPFCVLDEVDAALDESNIGRFTDVLSDFLSSTQFVVITHSKKTMTGADTLYGVTMQESGVSKQVSVRFEDVTMDGFIKPRASRTGDGEPPLARAA